MLRTTSLHQGADSAVPKTATGLVITRERLNLPASLDDSPCCLQGSFVRGGSRYCGSTAKGGGMYNVGSSSPTTCPWDLDGSGDVGINDFLALLANWGPCP